MTQRINYLIIGSLFLASAAYASDPYNGTYIGVSGGYSQSWLKSTLSTTPPPGGTATQSTEHNNGPGGNIGALIGFGANMGAYYLGGEFDVSKLFMANVYNSLSVQEPKPNAALGLSFLPGLFLFPNTLLFARIGVEGINYDQYAQNLDGTFSKNNKADTINVEAGIGVSYALTDHFLVRGEVDAAPAVAPINFTRDYTVGASSIHETNWAGYGQAVMSVLYKF